MLKFEFNQPLNAKDCAWRCVHSALLSRQKVLDDFYRFKSWFNVFDPDNSGLSIGEIARIFDFYHIKYIASTITNKGLYIISYPMKYNYYHCILYNDGYLYDSLENKPIKLSLENLQKRLETGEHLNALSCGYIFSVYKIL